jgi:hypothetical protein
MPKFTFIGEHCDLFGTPDGTKITYEFEVDSLDDVLQHVDLFVRGCGYNPSGTLDYVPNEDYYGEPPLGAGSDVSFGGAGNIHSQHFFDTERNK